MTSGSKGQATGVWGGVGSTLRPLQAFPRGAAQLDTPCSIVVRNQCIRNAECEALCAHVVGVRLEMPEEKRGHEHQDANDQISLHTQHDVNGEIRNTANSRSYTTPLAAFAACSLRTNSEYSSRSSREPAASCSHSTVFFSAPRLGLGLCAGCYMSALALLRPYSNTRRPCTPRTRRKPASAAYRCT